MDYRPAIIEKRLQVDIMKILDSFRTIRTQISLYFVIITVLIITMMGVSLFYTLSHIITAEADKYVATTIDKSASYLELYLNQIKGISRVFTENGQTRRLLSEPSTDSVTYQNDKADVERLIQTILSTNKELSSIILVGSDGRYITNEKQLAINTSQNMMDERWYQEALGKDSMPVLTSARMQDFSMDKDKWVISLRREVKGDDGQHLGVLLIDFKYDVIEKNLSGLDLGEDGFSFILNDRGEVVYHKDTAYFVDGDKRQQLVNLAQYPSAEMMGPNRVVHSYHMPNADWLLVGVASLDSTVRMQREMTKLMWLLGMIMLGCFLVSTVYFSRRVTDPILKLQKAMDCVEKDMLDIEISATGGLEAEKLAQHFNRMMQRIRMLLNDIMQKEKYLRTAELHTLHSQINPHFLYNTLDTIIWMAEFKDSEKVVALTKALARFFRLSLGDGTETTTVRDEIDHARQYLFIQQSRYEDKLRYEFAVDEAILDSKIPKIILQPIVENAIYHGIRTLTHGGVVWIGAYLEEQDLIFRVKDNGVGFDTTKCLDEIQEKCVQTPRLGGVGIRNVDKRLQLYYGSRYGVTIQSQIGGGTEVTMRMGCVLPPV